MTYKTCKFIWELDETKRVRIRKWETIADGLSWAEAKKMRTTDRSLIIVPER